MIPDTESERKRPMKIPKKLHIIWVGDDGKRPDQWIQTWRNNHPAWEFHLWGNAEYDSLPWKNKRQMDMFRAVGAWHGVADVMRYEILCQHGGVYVDADSVSVKPLDDGLLDRGMFAVWESEKHAPGQVSNGFIGAVPGHPVMGWLMERISHMKESDMYHWSFYKWKLRKSRIPPWRLVGPLLFSKAIKKFSGQVKILPSVFFIPKHYRDEEERTIYARHVWGTTLKNYSDEETLSREGKFGVA
jgi:mannosyltransferase OCH1-like enzyme